MTKRQGHRSFLWKNEIFEKILPIFNSNLPPEDVTEKGEVRLVELVILMFFLKIFFRTKHLQKVLHSLTYFQKVENKHIENSSFPWPVALTL